MYELSRHMGTFVLCEEPAIWRSSAIWQVDDRGPKACWLDRDLAR